MYSASREFVDIFVKKKFFLENLEVSLVVVSLILVKLDPPYKFQVIGWK